MSDPSAVITQVSENESVDNLNNHPADVPRGKLLEINALHYIILRSAKCTNVFLNTHRYKYTSYIHLYTSHVSDLTSTRGRNTASAS